MKKIKEEVKEEVETSDEDDPAGCEDPEFDAFAWSLDLRWHASVLETKEPMRAANIMKKYGQVKGLPQLFRYSYHVCGWTAFCPAWFLKEYAVLGLLRRMLQRILARMLRR